MALGGGIFTSQNKILPGSYINVISKAQPTAILGERGVVALPIALSWGNPGEVLTVTAEDFQKNSTKIFGYAYTAAELQTLREVFKHAQKVHAYNLNDGEGAAKAAIGTSFTAKNAGSRGNALKMVVQTNLDNNDTVDVTVYFDGSMVFRQTAVSSTDDLRKNDYFVVNTKKTAEELLTEVGAGKPFEGGADASTSAASYQNALDVFESYSFNVLVCPDSATYGTLYAEYTKRVRDAVGRKFQLVAVNVEADYEGVVNLSSDQANGLYWAAGALAGCAVNKSCTNMTYDGELSISTPHTQTELEMFIGNGVFAFHKVEDEVRVLMDINSLVTYTDEKGEMFSSNQVVRVADQCANDTAKMFNNEFLGKVQNDDAGRVSFWNRVLRHRRELETLRAIDKYDADALTVEKGEARNAVVVNEIITPISAMEKLYMTIVIN